MCGAVLVFGPRIGAWLPFSGTLGFLGIGIPPSTPTWMNMLANSLTSLVPMVAGVFPGADHTVTVLAFKLLGDGFVIHLDPSLRASLESMGRS